MIGSIQYLPISTNRIEFDDGLIKEDDRCDERRDVARRDDRRDDRWRCFMSA